MIKPEDIFYSFSGHFLRHVQLPWKKYKIQRWIYGKDDFYTYMYNKDAISKTTYYVKLKQRWLYAEKMS